MIRNEDLKKVFIISTITVLSLAGLFFISKTNALTPSSLDVPIPNPSTQTQNEIWAGNPQQVQGILGNSGGPGNSNSCGSRGQYIVVRTIKQNTQWSFTDVPYWQFDTWLGILSGTTLHIAEDWVENPPTYDLNCWTNEPQVRWRDAP